MDFDLIHVFIISGNNWTPYYLKQIVIDEIKGVFHKAVTVYNYKEFMTFINHYIIIDIFI